MINLQPQKFDHQPYTSDFSTYQSRQEKLRPSQRRYLFLHLILLLPSLFYIGLILISANWSKFGSALGLIHILAVNCMFFIITQRGWGSRKSERRSVFVGTSFILAALLIFLTPAISEEVVTLMGGWLFAAILTLIVYYI